MTEQPDSTAARVRYAAPALGAVMLLIAVLVTVTGNRQNSSADSTAVAIGGTQTVAVRLADMRITPSVITVASGTRLVLKVTNTDTVRHDLLVGTGSRTPMLGHGQTAWLDFGTLDPEPVRLVHGARS